MTGIKETHWNLVINLIVFLKKKLTRRNSYRKRAGVMWYNFSAGL